MKKLNTVLTLFVVIFLSTADCYKILFIAPIATKSHKNFYNGVIESLVETGNHVTVVSPFNAPKTNPNIEDIIIENNDIEALMPNVFQGNTVSAIAMNLFKTGPELCIISRKEKKVQKLIEEILEKKRNYDLILITPFISDCYFSLIYKLQIPFVQVYPSEGVSSAYKRVGDPVFPSFAPDLLITDLHPLTFGQRMKSVFTTLMLEVFQLISEYVSYKKCVESGFCTSDLPSMSDIKMNQSAIITNSIQILERPARPHNLNVIQAGGIHCKEAKPLPKDLEDWINQSGDSGFIFFSLGSAVRSTDMPEEYKNTLIKVFGSLKQRVLWKWNEDNIENLPSNVKIGKWFPQQDLLAHPKLQIFITHGGLHSTHESLYHKAKVIGMPLFGDQQKNMIGIQREGWGKILEWKDLTYDSLKNLIDEIIADENMKVICEERSKVMKDQISNPKAEIAYWMEYIIRHKGAKHLRSPILDLTWYELYNIDVWALILTVIAIIVFIELLILKFCVKKCMAKVGFIKKKKKE